MSNVFKNLKNKIHIIHNIYIKHNYFYKKKSYSMEKEDLEINKFLKRIDNGFYVDVGGCHPTHRNNTYLLYKKNWRGINIDLSKFSIDLFNYIRPDDINLNIAVSNKEGAITYYFQKKLSQLNTIKKNIAEKRMQGEIREQQISSSRLTSILDKTKFKNRKIDFLNIDAEGADYDVLKSLDFNIYRPRLICVEIDIKNIKQSEIYIFLKKMRYTRRWSATFSHLFTDDFFDFN